MTECDESKFQVICSCGTHYSLLTATVCPHCFAWPRHAKVHHLNELNESDQ